MHHKLICYMYICEINHCTCTLYNVYANTALYLTVLYCTVLYCTVLYCTVMYYAIVYSTVLKYMYTTCIYMYIYMYMCNIYMYYSVL